MSSIIVSNNGQSAAGLARLQRRDTGEPFAALEADTMPALTQLRLDLTRSTYVGRKGDLIATITDVEVTTWKRVPMLVLAHRNDPVNRQVMIPMESLWLLLSPEIPDDLRATLANRERQRQAILALAERLFGFATRFDCERVLDALFDFAEDLKNAKPPAQMTPAQWLAALAEDDMVLSINDQAQNS